MIDEAIYSILTCDVGVSALVGARVYPIIMPQDGTLPAIVFSRIATDRELSHSGSIDVTKGVFQISCFSETPFGAKQLAKAVYSAMHGYAGTVGTEHVFMCKCINEVDAFEQDTDVFHVPLDMLVTYKDT